MTSLTHQQIIERHHTKNRMASVYNKKYRKKTERARKGHNLRTRRTTLRRKIRERGDETAEDRAYIQQCRSKIDKVSKELVSLGFRA